MMSNQRVRQKRVRAVTAAAVAPPNPNLVHTAFMTNSSLIGTLKAYLDTTDWATLCRWTQRFASADYRKYRFRTRPHNTHQPHHHPTTKINSNQKLALQNLPTKEHCQTKPLPPTQSSPLQTPSSKKWPLRKGCSSTSRTRSPSSLLSK